MSEHLSGFTVSPYASVRPGDRVKLYYSGAEIRSVLVVEVDDATTTITVWPDTWLNRLELRVLLAWRRFRAAVEPWLRMKVVLRADEPRKDS